MDIMTIKDIQRGLGVGRILAERLARESGALLPRTTKGRYLLRRKQFEKFMEGGAHEER